MKAVLVFFLVACIATLVKTQEPCIQYDCNLSSDNVPTCGKFKNSYGCWEEVIFPSECHYLSANSCGRSVIIIHSHETTQKPCIMYKCSTVWDPVCGKQEGNGCMKVKIFTNACHMASANSCGKANWVPCVENVCEKRA